MKKSKLFGAALVIVFIVGGFLFLTHQQDMKIKSVFEEYPFVLKEERIDGLVTEIFEPSTGITNKSPHGAFLLINDSIKKSISVGYELRNHSMLNDILDHGLMIFKKAGSDTLYLYKVTPNDSMIQFMFVLR